LSYANETWFDPKPIIDNVLRVDPDRVLVPISGTDITDEPDRHHYETFPAFSDAYWNHVVYDIHRYPGWYWFSGEIWQLNRRYPAGHMITIGEFGAEALDSYATMLTYPANFAPTPPADSDVLWGAIQTQKADRRQIIGFRGNTPTNLAEYIQASQTYQADVLGEQLTGLRLSPRRIGGYFLFHFIDGVPVHWPKSIVSFDRRPKLSYYTFAQLNQPAVPLFVIADNGQSMQIWVGNDTDQGVRGATVSWTVTEGERTILQGQATADIPPVGTVAVERNVDLTPIDQGTDVVTVSLWLADACGQTISELRREVFLKAWRLQDGLFTPDFPTRQQWTMDGTGIGHQTGAAEADGTWSATVASHTAGYLQFGPYVSNVSAGTHKAMYRLQVDNVTADSGPIVRLEVSNFTQHIMLAQRDVTRDEWAAAQRYQTFELPFEMPADDSMRNDKIELRVFWYRRAYVREALVGYR